MMRFAAALLAAGALSSGCAGGIVGGGSVSAEVSVSAEINVPLAQMPPKYAMWVVEAEGYLYAVNTAYARFQEAKADLADALGVEVSPQAIADFIRSSIQIETKLICQPPSINASLFADCSAKAGARARGNAGSGGASGSAAAGIQANCRASAGLSLSPGSCTLETTVTEHPILSNANRWARIQRDMKVILQMAAVNVHLDGRGANINARGLQLKVESLTDLADDPSLALQLNNIQVELERGAQATGAANDVQARMNQEIGLISVAINAQFPDLRSAIAAQ